MGNSIPKLVMRMVTALVVAIRQSARHNPRAFSITALCSLLICYTLLAIPRTGINISSQKNLLTLSSGPTTVFPPPNRYLHKLVGKTASMRASPKLSIKTLKTDWDDLLKPLIRNGRVRTSHQIRASSIGMSKRQVGVARSNGSV